MLCPVLWLRVSRVIMLCPVLRLHVSRVIMLCTVSTAICLMCDNVVYSSMATCLTCDNVVSSSMVICLNNKTWCRTTYGHPPTNEQCSTTRQIFKTRFAILAGYLLLALLGCCVYCCSSLWNRNDSCGIRRNMWYLLLPSSSSPSSSAVSVCQF